MWGIIFIEFQCLPVNDCPAASCDSGVIARGSESTSFYSAILNQSVFPVSNLKKKRKKEKKKISLGGFGLGVDGVLCPLNRKPRIT